MMELVVALLLNALLLLLFGWWLRREYRCATSTLRRWLLPALAWRLVLTAISGSLPSPDAHHMSFWGRGLTASFWQRPGSAWALWQARQIHAGSLVTKKYGLSNTIFFIKILGLLNLASLGNMLLNALYLSLFCFVAGWLLVRSWAQAFPTTPPLAAVVALLLWPTVVWWTAGIGKETLLLGCEAALVALVLRQLYGPDSSPRGFLLSSRDFLASMVLAWLAYRMRFFFALPLMGALLALAAVRLATQHGWVSRRRLPQALAVLLLLTIGGWLGLKLAATQVPEGFYSKEIVSIYAQGLMHSANRPHLFYPQLQPTAASLLHYAPAAVANVFARPWLGESSALRYNGVALENLLLLAMMVLAAIALVRGRAGWLPMALVLVLVAYWLLVSAFIGLSTPNFGTISRYRAVLLPWLLLLLLQNDYVWASLGAMRRWGIGVAKRLFA